MIRLEIGAALVAAGLALAVPGVQAQSSDEQKSEIPKPAPEMAQLQVFDGLWNCEGKMEPSPFGPGGKMTSTVKGETDLGGFWQSGTVKSTLQGLPEFEGRFHITYDPAAKQYAMLWRDSVGAWAQSTSSGWQGDKLVFAGEQYMAGQKIAGRDTFIKTDDGAMKHQWEMQVEGKWAPMGEEICHRPK
jgi:hypothetical protein